ncbi:MAG: ATP-binding cassette domain-containing protein [Spirochaetaceae bacterium]|nr:ATP-binding cassette domain-containing protein [Spirochaetaceae bacterium]
MLVELENLSKSFGKTKALDNINLCLEKGKIIGLLGPNGSGKTTLIKVLMGLLRQYTGTAKINSIAVGDATKAMISYLPDKNHIPSFWTVKEACSFFADFFADFDTSKAKKIAESLNLDMNARIKKLSKGNQEKVSLMLTLSRNAQLYIFDEPIAGVDPVARDMIFSLIMEHYHKEASVIISTHLVHDVERILNEAVFLKNGKILLHKPVQEITSQGNSLEAVFKEEVKC